MYPNQPTPPTTPQAPLPSDYLNQIAPQGPKKSLFRFGIKQMIIIGVALIVLVSVLALAVGAASGGKREPLQRLSARLTATETIAVDAQTNLKSSKLRSLNSNLKLYMTNTNRDIAAPLLTAGVSAAKIDKSIIASESTAELASRLEDARLNGVYDATYAREMTYQLGTLLTLMNQIYGSSSNAELKTFLKTSYDNLKPTQESFANYSRASDD
jgi:predicted outer membrane protein